jgi:hypothetical protein
MEPFNMREERQQGNIDENFNFVFKKDKGEMDAWLADLDEASMEKGIGEAAAAFRVRPISGFLVCIIAEDNFSPD